MKQTVITFVDVEQVTSSKHHHVILDENLVYDVGEYAQFSHVH